MKTPILETERLLLRPFCIEDTEDVFECWESDPDVAKYMFWSSHNDIEKTKEWIDFEIGQISKEDWYRFAIVLKEADELIGTGLIYYEDEVGCWEIGYNLGKKFWGYGYATEAMQKIIAFAKNELHITEIVGRYAKENPASGNVMQKLGFRYEKDIPYACNNGTVLREGVQCRLILADMAKDKRVLRKQVLNIRKALTAEQIAEKSARIITNVLATAEYNNTTCIYVYMPAKGEVDVTSLIEAAWRDGKKVAVPKVIDKDMIFYYIKSFDDLESGYFGILEPKDGLEAATCENALLIIPGVAFDKAGHRIGYGGGFYDRYLEKHTGHFVMAPAYDFQVVDKIAVEEHDIGVDMVVSER